MTPPDNSREGGSGANTDTSASAVPPWQRIGGDGGEGTAAGGNADGDGAVTAQDAAGTDTAHAPQAHAPQAQAPHGQAAPAQHGPNDAGEAAMFSGAANKLFGPQGGTAQFNAPPGAQPNSQSGSQSNAQSPSVSALRRPGRGPRRANLQVKRFDPWSVLKLSLVLGVALFFIWLVAVGVLYTVLDGMGVWDSINGTYTSLVQDEGAGGGDPLITAGTVFGVAAIVGAVNIVLISALTTVGAFIYNVCADLAGGLEVTLSERE